MRTLTPCSIADTAANTCASDLDGDRLIASFAFAADSLLTSVYTRYTCTYACPRFSRAGHAAMASRLTSRKRLPRDQHKDADVRIGPPLDLASLDSVRSFAAAWDAEQRPLHILVNNAGTNYDKEEYTPEGVGITAQVCQSLTD